MQPEWMHEKKRHHRRRSEAQKETRQRLVMSVHLSPDTTRGWWFPKQSPLVMFYETQALCIPHMLSLWCVGPGVKPRSDECGQGEVGPLEVIARNLGVAKFEQLRQRNEIACSDFPFFLARGRAGRPFEQSCLVAFLFPESNLYLCP